MTTEIEKALAILQVEGDKWFTITNEEGEEIAYIGDGNRAMAEWESRWSFSIEDIEPSYEQWVIKNCQPVEPYDEYDWGRKWLVYTDEEADDAMEKELDNYIEDCILPEIPEGYRYYFDDEKWKRDARMDGRGHSLSHYDGYEHEESVNGTYYYLYRQ